MSRYRPGTLDDYAVIRRRQRKTARLANEANIPTGSQVNDTSAKVNDWDGWKVDIDAETKRAKAAADSALSAASSAQSAAKAAQEIVEQQQIPKEIRFSLSQSPPEGWTIAFSWISPGGVVYAYERKSSDDSTN